MSLEPILSDIQRAIDAGAYYAALSTIVTLPELCGRCEQIDIFSVQGTNRTSAVYERFADTYLSGWSLGLTGLDLFSLRCGLSHRGQTAQKNSDLKYIFHPPVYRGPNRHGARGFSTGVQHVIINLQIFCSEIADAVRKWEVANINNDVAQRNLKNILQVRELSPGSAITGGICLS
jgi:hypothetical protein